MNDEPDKHNSKCNSKMDKKISTSFPPSSNKANTLDSSTKTTTFARQDGASGSQVCKLQQKTPSRSRGHFQPASGGGGGPPAQLFRNNEGSRNKPIRGRGYAGDRRGKPKGGQLASESVARGIDRGPEAGSIQFPGGKKQNFDDLWGFHFAPREGRMGFSQSFHGRSSHPPGGGPLRHNVFGAGSRAKYAKDYLLANCQFLVRMGEDYTVYLADPNLLVNWDLIEHVRIRIDGETPKCPICLDFPVAAKITKCGHIYCWSCFLHYLALSDNKTRTCPICYEPVSRKDLKSVSLLGQEGLQVGSKIEMQLMVREKDGLMACPVEKYTGWESRFCKILQVAPETVISKVLCQERAELDSVFASEADAPEVCFIQEALDQLNEREVLLSGLQGQLEVSAKNMEVSLACMLAPDIVFNQEATTEGVNAEVTPIESERKGKTRNDSVGSNSSCGAGEDPVLVAHFLDHQGDCYFYQITDGRNIFLHPLNMAMLWRELGTDPGKWPQVLTFEVIDVESKAATDELRKRMKFIRHLPKNAPFDLVEVSMTEWGISPEVYTDFASQIGQREQRRRKRAKEEKNLEKKLKERENAEFHKLRNHPSITSPQEFPAFEGGSQFSVQDFPEHEAVALEGASAELGLEASDESLPNELTIPCNSFAQIAGKAALKKSPTYPLPRQAAWGGVASPAPPTVPHRHSDSENEGEDYLPVPNYRASVSDAIAKAMAGLELNREAEGSPSAGGRKKKGKKGKVLFATGMGGFQ